MAVTLAGAAFLVLNAIAVLHIGPHTFLVGYHRQTGYSFAPGGLNDPLGPGRGARVDVGALLAGLPDRHLLTYALQAAVATLFAIRAVRSGLKRAPGLGLTEAVGLALLTLVLFYHRAYDTMLLLPGHAVVAEAWRRGRSRPAHWSPAALIILGLAAVGNHNLVDMALRHFGRQQPP